MGSIFLLLFIVWIILQSRRLLYLRGRNTLQQMICHENLHIQAKHIFENRYYIEEAEARGDNDFLEKDVNTCVAKLIPYIGNDKLFKGEWCWAFSLGEWSLLSILSNEHSGAKKLLESINKIDNNPRPGKTTL